jgi:hypothetical protein
MRFEVRLKISGAEFDPNAFTSTLPPEDAGEVRRYRGVRSIQAGLGSAFWISKPIKVLESPEEGCITLLSSLNEHLKLAKASGGKISVQISAYHRASDDPRGMYVPSELVHLMGQLDADLDYSPEVDSSPDASQCQP